MCYHYSLKATKRDIEKQYQLSFDQNALSLGWKPTNHANAFDHPLMPIITNKNSEFAAWGLIPNWSKTEKLEFNTANAKVEGIEDKPSWKKAVASQRCLIPSTGFFEWRLEAGKKYPYYIYNRQNSFLTFAGIWDSWTSPDQGTTRKTFSILTTKANPLMERIHNTKKRMPLILSSIDFNKWCNPDTSFEALKEIMNKDVSESIEAYTLNANFMKLSSAAMMNKQHYPELNFLDSIF